MHIACACWFINQVDTAATRAVKSFLRKMELQEALTIDGR